MAQHDEVVDDAKCYRNACLDIEGVMGRQEEYSKSLLEHTKCTFDHIACGCMVQIEQFPLISRPVLC